jgi:hypothetical protein
MNKEVHAGQHFAFVYILSRMKFVKRLTIFLTRKLSFTWLETAYFSHDVFRDMGLSLCGILAAEFRVF